MVVGDITSITFNHPTLGTGTLYPKAAEDSSFDLGGLRSNDDKNMIDGSGSIIDQMTNNRWTFETTLAGDMNTREDLEKLVSLAGSPVLADWAIAHINGTVYGGKGKPVGDVILNGNTGNLPLKLSGSGKLKKIVG